MFENMIAKRLFKMILRRHDIRKAYKMVGPEDSWYDTITTVHRSLAEIQQLPHEDWEITSHDGLSLKAVYYPGTTDKTMIWVHGYTSHGERESAFPGLFYHSLGYNVLVPYMRAHGPSQGKYITLGPLESLDVQKWVRQVNDRHPKGRILIHGLSMGGGIVLDLATQEMENVACLISDAPSTDILGYSPEGKEKVHELLLARYRKVIGYDPRDFDRVKNIADGKYPLLLSAGSMENMDEVLNSLKERNPQPTTVVILPGCNHGNGMYKQTQMYQSAIKEFIGKYMDA